MPSVNHTTRQGTRRWQFWHERNIWRHGLRWCLASRLSTEGPILEKNDTPGGTGGSIIGSGRDWERLARGPFVARGGLASLEAGSAW